MKKHVSLFKRKAFLATLCLIFFSISAVIIVALNIGQHSGTFVIKVQETNAEREIKLTLDLDDKTAYSNRLTTEGISNVVDNNPYYFLAKDENGEYTVIKELTKKLGVNHDTNEFGYTSLFCYSFYIKNTGTGTVDVNSKMTYGNVSKNNDKIARIMTVRENSNGVIEALDIYYKKDDDSAYVDYTTKNYSKTPISFLDDKIVFSGKNRDERFQIRESDYVKYSVFYWMEGEDPDSEKYGDQLLGGTIRFDLEFNVDMTL